MNDTQDIRLTLGQEYDDAFRIRFEDFCIVTQSVRDGINVTVTVKDAHGDTLLGDAVFGAAS